MESGRKDAKSNSGDTSASAVAVTQKSRVDDNDDDDDVTTFRKTPTAPNTTDRVDHELSDMGKQNGEKERAGDDDEATTRMLADEAKITPTKDSIEVKFISENGDAKIDIETVTHTLSGMGKEELMKFANDPYWIRLRWFLFITFWVFWVLMLFGAVLIIVTAPKCSAPKPKQWWEESAIVRLDPTELSSNDLKSLKSILDEMHEQNIKAISLASILKETSSEHVEDFMDINPQLGEIVDLEDFIEYANKKDQHIILELDPNHSSMEHPWFKQSIEKKEPYTSYYVWVDGKTSSDGKRSPPNNWLSVNGGSAWQWNEQRGQYYLHQFNQTQPDLNFNNSAVIAEFSNILSHWLKLGIDGFRLANIRYLTEDPNLHDESISSIPTAEDNYGSLVHVYTRDRPENAAVLMKWQEIVYNATDGKGLFALQDDIGADMLEVFNEKKTLISLPQSSQFLTTADANINATKLNESISQWISTTSWPGWDINGKQRSLRQRMPDDIADSVTLMTLLLPGTPILRLNDTLSAKNAFAILSKARTSATCLYGETMTTVVNGTVFVYTRLKSGNPGYLVAYQSDEQPTIVDLSSIPRVSEEITVLTYSPNYVQDSDTFKTKLPSNTVPISPKSTLILTFVPKG